MATSSNSSTLSKKHQKQLSQLQNLLNTEVPIVVVETGDTPVIDTDSGSDSDDLSPLPNTEVPTITNLEFINTRSNQTSCYDKIKHHDMGRMDQTCQHCKARFWMIEKDKNSGYAAPRFPLCCANSKVQLSPLLEHLLYLLNLYTSTNSDTVEFCKYARDYNSALACISFAPDVAAIMVGDSYEVNPTNQNILLRMHDGNLQKIAETPRKSSATMIGQLYMVQPSEVALKKLALILVFFRMIQYGIPLLWNNHKIALCKDILYQAYVQLQNLEDASNIPATIEHEALTQLKNILLLNRKSLKDFSNMPILSITSNISNNEKELNYLILFDAIIREINNEEDECFFMDRPY
ncbi:12274_t:CDS:2, partial [Dentiscutata erythropus]